MNTQCLYEKRDGTRVDVPLESAIIARSRPARYIVENLTSFCTLIRERDVQRGKAPRPLHYGGRKRGRTIGEWAGI